MAEQELEKKVAEKEEEFELEIEDDTPEEDRNREPLPENLKDELEKDELEEYSDNVKNKLKQMKKVWHDERREKEKALRENDEAAVFAKKLMEENKKLKGQLTKGEENYVTTYKAAAELEIEAAKKGYKEAYDTGDADKLVDAQENLTKAQYKLQKAKEYVPSLQETENTVNTNQQQSATKPDAKAIAWQERNSWYGQDEEMTSLALGYHQKLVRQNGESYPTTDEYWGKIDQRMRQLFPDKFPDAEEKEEPKQKTEKPSTVVAPATRSTSSKKVNLKKSEIHLAKRLGLTPEQYAKEKIALEVRNA